MKKESLIIVLAIVLGGFQHFSEVKEGIPATEKGSGLDPLCE